MLDDLANFGKQNSKILLALAAVLIVSVGGFMSMMTGLTTSSGDAYEQSGKVATSGASADLAMDASSRSSEVERKRIETYNMDFEAPDVRDAVSSSQSIAEDFGGYSTSENFHNNDGYGDSASVTVRVPKQNVSEFLDELEAKNWKLESKNRNVNDVTDRYTELELELKNKRQELEKLEELMDNANRTEDLINIQERMGELRSRIQYLETQMAEIDNKVDYTRIDLRFEEPEPLTSEFELRKSFANAYQAIFDSINFAIVGIGYLLPFAVLYGAYRVFSRVRGEE